MTLEQAREAVRKDYPGDAIGLGFEYEGAWYFSVGDSDGGGIHAVDNKTGVVTGCLPLLILLNDKKFFAALKEASGVKKNVTDPFDTGEIEHSDCRIWRGDEFLAHHGIMGQKWGIRRFQDKFGRLTPEGRMRYLKYNPESTEETKEGLTAEAAIAAFYLSTTAVSVTALAVTAAVESHNEKMGDKLLDKKGIADTSKKFSNDNPPRKIEGEHTAEEDMAKINDAYGALRPQTQNNCSHCSITMELRRRGFDVCARTSSEPVYTKHQLEKAFKPNPKYEEIGWDKPKNWYKMTKEQKQDTWARAKTDKNYAKNFKEVEQRMLKKFPEGSRGLFSAVCPYSMIGHAMAFEVKGGKVVIYDTQTNKKFNLSSPPSGFSQAFAPTSAGAYRLDNKAINWDGLNDICAERKKKS